MKKVQRSLMLILCIIFVCMLVGCGSDESKVQKALDKYFDAYGDMSLEAIHNATYPDEVNDASCKELLCENDYDYYEYWKETMGFPRSKWDSSDYAPLQLSNFKVMYEEYPMVYEGENGILVDAEGNQLTLKEALPDFSISYEIVEMKPFRECKVSENLDGREVETMNDIVPAYIDTEKLDVEEMYVAKLNVEWSYGNNLYGFNQDWWQDKDYSAMSPYTYEECIEEYASREYIVFIYKHEGDWYVYPERLELAHIIWDVEF